MRNSVFMGRVRDLRRARLNGLVVLLVGLALTGVALVLHMAQRGLESLGQDNALTAQRGRTREIANHIESAIATRSRRVKQRLADMGNVLDVALGSAKPDNPEVLTVLETAKRAFDASLAYVLNREGLVVACTPYEGTKTLTGENYRFRPYFVDAMAGKDSVYTAVGVTTGARGLYSSSPVRDGITTELMGVLVFKGHFDEIDQLLAKHQEPIALISNNGVILASNRSDWLYRLAYPISEKQRAELIASRQWKAGRGCSTRRLAGGWAF